MVKALHKILPYVSDIISHFSPFWSLCSCYTGLIPQIYQGSFHLYTACSLRLECSSPTCPMVHSFKSFKCLLTCHFSVTSNLTTLFKLETVSNLYISFKHLHCPQPASHYLFPKYLPPFTYYITHYLVCLLFIVCQWLLEFKIYQKRTFICFVYCSIPRMKDNSWYKVSV